MKKFDVSFSIVCGILVAELVNNFYGFNLGIFGWILFLILPVISLFCLWLMEIIGQKYLFIFQAGKHVLVGVFATIVDLKSFLFLAWFFPGLYQLSSIIIKTLSFILAIIIKYVGNKFWTFQKTEEGISRKEFTKFLITNSIGLVIDVLTFYILTKVLGQQFGISFLLWEKLSILISAILAGVWNFCGDKFFVFKK
jgi:putative flippase GtrA